jgi:SOS-response transcriptional repressor LexA
MAHNPHALPYRERAQQVNTFVSEYIADHGYSPSLQEIGDELGVAKSAVFAVLQRMVDEGLITYAPGVARTVRPTGAAMRALEEPT